MNGDVGRAPVRRLRPSGGGWIVLVGVATLVASVLTAAADLTSFAAGRGAAAILLTIGLTLLGAGLAMLGIEGAGPFGSTLGRRGVKTLAAGLVLDGAILGLLSTGAVPRSVSGVVILPLIVASWTTVTGLVLTILTLLIAGGPHRRLGWLFVAAILALIGANAFTNMIWFHEVGRMIGLALGAVAACGVLAGIAGIGLISVRAGRPRAE